MPALKKDYPWKGYTPQHWRIINRQPNEDSDTVTVTMGVWKNKATYDAQPAGNKRQDMLPITISRTFTGSELTKAQILELFKLSYMVQQPDPANPGQFIMVESNPLVGAVDDNT